MTKVVTPSGDPITVGQVGKLQELLGAALRKSGLMSEPTQTVIETQGESLVAELVSTIRKRVEAMMALAFRGSVTVTLAEAHNPDAFYRNRTGLYVWQGFRDLVVATARPSEANTFTLARAELMRNLTDAEIEAGLPIEHLFEESAVCAIVAGMIAEQPNGEEGKLLNNGYANLFYTRSCVVCVRWYAVDRGWHVSACRRGGHRWRAGGQVFSPAN